MDIPAAHAALLLFQHQSPRPTALAPVPCALASSHEPSPSPVSLLSLPLHGSHGHVTTSRTYPRPWEACPPLQPYGLLLPLPPPLRQTPGLLRSRSPGSSGRQACSAHSTWRPRPIPNSSPSSLLGPQRDFFLTTRTLRSGRSVCSYTPSPVSLLVTSCLLPELPSSVQGGAHSRCSTSLCHLNAGGRKEGFI